MLPPLPVPVLAVCGYSGSGKTTLLTQVIPKLVEQGLEVGVIKHDAHGVEVDLPGKDSDRLFRAGSHVLLRAPNETFSRWQHPQERELPWALRLLAQEVDLILVEGHKDTPLPKVWLQHPQKTEKPPGLANVRLVLPWGEDRAPRFLAEVTALLQEAVLPVWAGILMGGQSSRMGTPKQLLDLRGESLLGRLAHTLLSKTQALAYLGSGPLPGDAPPAPQLPDPPGPGGPLAGMVAAMRWQPSVRWLFVPVDAVTLGESLLHWWFERLAPGHWAVVLQDPQGQPIPVFAAVAPQLRPFLETVWEEGRGPRALLRHRKSRILAVPTSLASELITVNTWQEWQQVHNRQQEQASQED